MAEYYTVSDVLAYMDIPMPEDDDSDDDFEGYIDEEEIGNYGRDRNDGGDYDGDLSGESDEGSSDEGIPQYRLNSGCTQDMTNKTPIDFFQLFVTDDILEAIVEQTNLFAQQYIDSHELSRRSRVQQWAKSPHDVVELKKFLALIIIMGLISYPSIEDYWVSWPFATPTFSSILKCDRFSLLMRFLHLNDSSKYIPKGEPGYDALYKLRPFADPLIANFRAAYMLGREVSVDEAMTGFKGRL